MNDTGQNNFTPVLTIAGSDNCGGAGIQADLKTFSALGCYGLSAITSVTAQSSAYFLRHEPLSSQMVYDQIVMSVKQARPVALKTGMLATEEIIYTVSEAVQEFSLENLVIDPVLKSSTGASLGEGRFINCLKDDLFPHALVITPNIPEAEQLTGITINTYNDIENAGFRLLKTGAKAVVIKGGHINFDSGAAVDTLFTENNIEKITTPRLSGTGFHGTGCTFSAAICSFIARGFDISSAVHNAKRFVFNAMKQANPENPGILNHACIFSLGKEI